jgi:acyl-CoA thioester hydrolase
MKIEPLKIQVRFSDLDMLGHVNNVIYLSYFEMARIHYFTALVGAKWDWFNEGVLLVKNNVEYHIPILLHDQPSHPVYSACAPSGTTLGHFTPTF